MKPFYRVNIYEVYMYLNLLGPGPGQDFPARAVNLRPCFLDGVKVKDADSVTVLFVLFIVSIRCGVLTGTMSLMHCRFT